MTENTEKEIKNVCLECGTSANVLTCLHKYGFPPRKLSFDTSTWHAGKCDVCTKTAFVTETRDFFYPDFDLLKSYRGVKGVVIFRAIPTPGDTVTVGDMFATFEKCDGSSKLKS